MPKRSDSSRTKRNLGGEAPPDQAAVERALEQVVERLKPKAPAAKPVCKPTT
ncbi:hypothetical protein [Methylorubrum zatmanii]|uniref:Transposase n=1 Tax=Methylorubrum zatmanii TaxID=29429 RepID=A0ABW1WSH2_9HYPH|nr:hypothetical protein [Methylorubrum zatmanii]